MSGVTRRWFYLGGYFRDPEGQQTTDPGDANFPPSAWFEYDPQVSFLLSDQIAAFQPEHGTAAELLNLSAFTDPPLPYSIWKAPEIEVTNPCVSAHKWGKRTIAGFDADFWHKLNDRTSLLPKSVAQWVDMGFARVVPGFYQVAHESVGYLAEYTRFLQDSSGATPPPSGRIRKRAVILVEFVEGWDDMDLTNAAKPVNESPPALSRQEELAMTDDAPPVFEWWYGERGPQQGLEGTPRGFWKKYHPQICRRLEAAFQNDSGFRDDCLPTDIDGVRYMLQRVTEQHPFEGPRRRSSFSGGVGAAAAEEQVRALEEEFPLALIITVDHPCFDQIDRSTRNCLVQFHKANPLRRRVARRRMNATDMARNAARTGEPCLICFSEDGEMTGCSQGHVICGTCLRFSLRSLTGDVLTTQNLLCGCFNRENEAPLQALAARADSQLRQMINHPPTAADALQEFEYEQLEMQQRFGLEVGGPVPEHLYQEKLRLWLARVQALALAPLYHICSHPDCAEALENWILRVDFDREFRDKGQHTWHCPRGHENCVLPSEDEIRDANRNILFHPEYYTSSVSYDNLPMRRLRFCPGCVCSGTLLLAAHDAGCKQWPGTQSQHQHCFCFSCTKRWGDQCGHSRPGCRDPGIQQVRRTGDQLEIGFVNGTQYIAWMEGARPHPPPTIFPSEPREVDGDERQALLGMTDREVLLRESRSGN